MSKLKTPDRYQGTMAQVRAGLFGDNGGPMVEMLIEDISRLEAEVVELKTRPIAPKRQYGLSHL